MKFRKKPVEIDAFQFYVDAMPDWFTDKVAAHEIVLRESNNDEDPINESYCEIETLEGTMIADGGDYIVQGVQGEIYPVNPAIFEATYEPVQKEEAE